MCRKEVFSRYTKFHNFSKTLGKHTWVKQNVFQMAREKQGVGILKAITRETSSNRKNVNLWRKRTHITNEESCIKAGHWELPQYQVEDCGCYPMMPWNSSVMSPDCERQLFSFFSGYHRSFIEISSLVAS